MERVSLDDLDPTRFGDGTVCRAMADPLATDHVAVNHYRVPPGAGFPGGLHAHLDQEEVFVVLEGSATFETLGGPVSVDAAEAVRFAPGEFQSGRNPADDVLIAVAIGAPRDTEEVRVPSACPTCGYEPLRLDTDGGELAFGCPDCGAAVVPSACPACGADDLQFTTDAKNDPIVVCRACATEFDGPPLEDRGGP